jgi:hypothetical protein
VFDCPFYTLPIVVFKIIGAKMKSLLIYLMCLVIVAYLIIAFSIGFALWIIPFALFESWYGHVTDPILTLIFRGIPCLITGFGLAYLAYLPVRAIIKKTFSNK